MSSIFSNPIVRTLLLGAVAVVMSATVAAESSVTSGSKAATMETCIAPTIEMRKNHMDMLKHDRDLSVRKGMRNTEASLAECVSCHAEKSRKGGYTPINAEGQFCESCHSYVAVDLTCFQCHRKTPEEVSRMNALKKNPHGSFIAQQDDSKSTIKSEQ